MHRVCVHVLEKLTVTKQAGKPTLYGTVFECGLKRQGEARRNEVCAANNEKAITDLCPCVGAWPQCPFYAPRPLEEANKSE